MAYYNLQRVEAQGFMSFDTVEFNLSDLGTVVVNGRNRFEPKTDSNGSGKSALFDMIVWVLTGSTSRGATNVSNEILNNGVYVKLEASVDEDSYEIIRSKNHPEYGTGLKISKNGEDISGDTLTDSKSILSKELDNLDYDTLTSIIILSQGLPGRLSSLKPSSRKSRLEELSKTEHYIEEVKSKIDRAISELSESQSSINSRILACDSEINSNKFQITNNERKINEISQNAEGLLSKEEYEEAVKSFEEMTKSLEEAQAEFNQIQSTISRNEMTVKQNNQEIDRLKAEIQSLMMQFQSMTSAKCPTCGHDITDSQKLQEMKEGINAQIIDRKKRIGELLSATPQLEDDTVALRGRLEPFIATINDFKSEIAEITTQINNYKAYSSSTEILLEAIERSNQIIMDKEKEKKELEEERQGVIDQLEIANFYKNQASRKFRSFLLEGVVEYINHKAKEYSPYLFEKQGVVNLQIDKNNIDIYLGDRPFENLSGGEGRRVDIILQIIQRDLARNESGLSSNVLVLDEILDYLDATGIDSVLRLLEYKSPDINSLLVVTHKKDVKVPADTSFTVIKGDDQISKLVIAGA